VYTALSPSGGAGSFVVRGWLFRELLNKFPRWSALLCWGGDPEEVPYGKSIRRWRRQGADGVVTQVHPKGGGHTSQATRQISSSGDNSRSCFYDSYRGSSMRCRGYVFYIG
jgi:hypothetical protein